MSYRGTQMPIQQGNDALLATVDADVALVLLVGALLIRLARRGRQPAVIGEILAGIALGPSVLGLLPGHLDQRFFPLAARPFLSAIAQLGLLLFMFTIGWELDPTRLGRAKRAVATVSLGSMALPFLLALSISVYCYNGQVADGHKVGFWEFALYLGVCLSITAFPVLARILMDGRLIGTPVGSLAMASAAMGDVLAWCLLAAVVAVVTASGSAGIAAVLAWSAVYILGMALIVRPVLRIALRRMDGQSLACLSGIVAAGILLSSYCTAQIGIHPIFGAFAFGLIMPREPARQLEEHMVRPFRGASGLLLPVYFIVTGLSVDIAGLRGRDYVELLLVIAVACVGKIVGASLPAHWGGSEWRDSLAVGVLMNTRGLTELIVLNLGLTLGVLDAHLFTVLVLMALITTTMTGPLLPRLLSHVEYGRLPETVAELVGAGADSESESVGALSPAGRR